MNTAKKILIIDDSSYMRGKIRGMILKSGFFEIEEAADGIRGLQLAATDAYDVILLDVIMPGFDGFKILKALSDKGVRSKVIIITADIQESVQRQCMELGAFSVLHKPPREDQLMSRLGEALG